MKAVILLAALLAVVTAQTLTCSASCTARNAVHYQFWNHSGECAGTANEDSMYCSADCYPWGGKGYLDFCTSDSQMFEFEFPDTACRTNCTDGTVALYHHPVAQCSNYQVNGFNQSEQWTACVPDQRTFNWLTCTVDDCAAANCTDDGQFAVGSCRAIGSNSGRFWPDCTGTNVYMAQYQDAACTTLAGMFNGGVGTCQPMGSGKWMKVVLNAAPTTTTPATTSTSNTPAPTTTSAASRLSLF